MKIKTERNDYGKIVAIDIELKECSIDHTIRHAYQGKTHLYIGTDKDNVPVSLSLTCPYLEQYLGTDKRNVYERTKQV